MLIQLLKGILRHMWLERLYTFLNLAGLSVSFCCFMLLCIFLQKEFTTDQHFPDHERIYRLVGEVDIGAQHTWHAKTGALVAPLLAQDYEQFSDYVRFYSTLEGNTSMLLTENVSREWSEGVYSADNSVFDIFSHDVIAGDPSTALIEPRTLAISQSTAEFYFGDEDPIGKTIAINAPGNDFTVVLVFADLPDNTSLHYDILISRRTQMPGDDALANYEDGIALFNEYTYFRLPASWDPSRFDEVSAAFFERHVSAGASQMFPGQNTRLTLKLQPIEDIHFAPAYEEDVPKGNKLVASGLAIVALFVLGVASANYMMLTTARYSQRFRETGVRKVMGASATEVAVCFLLEAQVLALFALLLACGATEVLLNTAFSGIFPGTDFNLLTRSGTFVLAMLATAIVVGLISGAYPAYYFSAVRPVDIFRPVVRIRGLGLSVRHLLTGLQLLVSISVIAAALTMAMQMRYVQNKSLGFERENKLDIMPKIVGTSSTYRAALDRVRAHPGVLHGTMTDNLHGGFVYNQPMAVVNDQGGEVNFQGYAYIADEAYLETFKIPLLQGRNFTVDSLSSSDLERMPLLVNETFVREAGWDQALGKLIRMPAEETTGEVIGVIADFHYDSLHREIEPFVLDRFYEDYRWQRHFILDIDPTQTAAVIEHAAEVMREFAPGMPLQYRFLDDTIAALYAGERRQMQLLLAGAAVCILISLLGIFGMTASVLEHASREVAIRRVFGGGLLRIMAYKLRMLLVLVTAAGLVSPMLVFYVLDKWLAGFAYHAELAPGLFLVPLALVFVLVLSTITLHGLHLSKQKPVLALRYE